MESHQTCQLHFRETLFLSRSWETVGLHVLWAFFRLFFLRERKYMTWVAGERGSAGSLGWERIWWKHTARDFRRINKNDAPKTSVENPCIKIDKEGPLLRAERTPKAEWGPQLTKHAPNYHPPTTTKRCILPKLEWERNPLFSWASRKKHSTLDTISQPS